MMPLNNLAERLPQTGPRLEGANERANWFATTHWSVVLAAARHSTPEAARALETLCASYWYPLYAWLRWQHHGPEDAQDLTQAFFAFLLERDALQTVAPEKGKFRSFLLASLKHFLANERDKARALKRGGHLRIVSIEEAEGEGRFRQEPSRELAPDRAFEQAWAMTLFSGVLARLRDDYVAEGKTALYDALHPYLTDEGGKAPYAETARLLGLGEGTVRMAVLRMRRRFGELLRAEIAQTVAEPEEVDEEIRALLAAVAG
jgi:RNA polymerase sigma factor (sigma-70 family)